MCLRYDWDPAKAADNIAKHGVAFEAMDGFDWSTISLRKANRKEVGFYASED